MEKKSGYVYCTINGGKKIEVVLYGDYCTDIDDENFWNYFEIKKVVCGALPEWFEDEKLFDGETASGDYFDEFRVLGLYNKQRHIKFLFDYEDTNKTIYRTFNLRD